MVFVDSDTQVIWKNIDFVLLNLKSNQDNPDYCQ